MAGVPGEVRVAQLPHGNFGTFFPTNPGLATGPSLKVKGLEGGTDYRAFYFDPRSGDEQNLGEVSADQGGGWQPPASPPIIQDWVLVLEASRLRSVPTRPRRFLSRSRTPNSLSGGSRPASL